MERHRKGGDKKQDDNEPHRCRQCGEEIEKEKEYCSDKCQCESKDDLQYWLQDLINTAREMGISKREFLEDYYFDEFIILMERQAVMNKRRNDRMEREAKKPKKEPVEEVGWDQMGI
ncbi:MAG: hypothetical protein Q8882_08320 [Bacillota bacterium]|nr:hypothetical protein [Bacillota bacterium]